MKRRALFSVSDKTGVVELARRVSALGYEIVSTGGTAAALRAGGVPVVGISEITGFPECLGGRLKTLHPFVHGGILAMRDNPDHMAQLELLGIEPIDIVVINLYPFKQTILKEGVQLAEAIENIDIGGPTMIRSAAKNWQDVVVVIDPIDYEMVADALEEGGVSRETRFALASKVFEHTAHYDALIAEYLRHETGRLYPETLTLTFEKEQALRYGENPNQSAAFYRETGRWAGTLPSVEQIHGKELSYNNIGDLNGAIELIREFEEPCVVAVKHMNPCGVGLGRTLPEAWENAYEADPVSIFGGIVALNRTCDAETAAQIHKLFIEIVVAPAFTDEAVEILSAKKNLRLLTLELMGDPHIPFDYDLRRVSGGLLVQSRDNILYDESALRVVTKRAPTEQEAAALRFAWKVVKYVKSNAIVLANNRRTVGIGPGQTNRVTALKLAIQYAGEAARGAVMASDAFFPFEDCVREAERAGVTAIIQPGGSVGDQKSIDAADAAGIAMLFTGVRHFRH
ncbi:MAG: bifunctional phosphoribosylaminoimidazolecarboxamide formyltransferase/IMP cyclohydrolase [Oscillospiraceae bacterium]|jgi:phosphoribosylaminoimidazolecarboxamide formyltransferase/IMP cyclohydrolase|nr:bifunctional phosphoribosylaminoimidazolecarboxamide formyltransferase/IMP cyclohydrolase [Oscillospiraceae bacterium]